VDDSDVTLEEVDEWLEGLTRMTKDEERIPHCNDFIPRLTVSSLLLHNSI